MSRGPSHPPVPAPWNGWYHCTAQTYGTWLRGDKRGWRSRHHREHVEGDYKTRPPAGTYDALHERSRELMHGVPVLLEWEQRCVVCAAVAQRLTTLDIEFVDVGMTAKHLHALLRIPQSPGIAIPGLCKGNALQDGRDPRPRHIMGLAKKHAYFELKHRGIALPVGLWGTRGKQIPIEDRRISTTCAATSPTTSKRAARSGPCAQRGAWI